MTVDSVAVAEESPVVQSGDAGSEGFAAEAANVSEPTRLPVPLHAASNSQPPPSDQAVLPDSSSSASADRRGLPPAPRPPAPRPAAEYDVFAAPWRDLGLPSPRTMMNLENQRFLSSIGAVNLVQRLGNGMVVKYGKGVREAEERVMTLARAQGLPVPAVHGYYRFRGRGYLFMEHVESVELDQAWPHLSPVQRSALLSSISSAVARIHSLSRDLIGLPDGAAPTSLGIFQARASSLSSPRELLEHLKREFVQRLKGNDFYTPSPAFLSLFDDPSFVDQTSFTLQHCDLAPRNILVDPVSGELKSIIDWEEAAFLPVGFEYAALRFESWLSGELPGGKELCEALMALATEEEKRIGEILWDDIGRFLEAERWVE
ncbi:hypothetical protein JCM10213_006127 [Rhodosporidiobolus nylandii]